MPTKSRFQVTMTHIEKHFQQIEHALLVCIALSGGFWRMALSSLIFEYLEISCHHSFALQNWCFRRAPRRPWTTLMLPRASHPSTVTCTHLGDERNKVTPSLCLEVTRSHARNVECKVRCLSIFCSATRIRTDLQHGPGEYLFMIATSIQAARYCSLKSLLGRVSPQMEQMVGDPFNTHRLNFNDRSLINCFASSVLCLNGLSVGLDLRKCCNSGKKDLCVFMCVVCTVEFHLWSVHCACCRAISVCQVLACHKLLNWWDSICPQRIGRCLRWEMGWPGSLKVSKRREVWVYGKQEAATPRWSEWNQMCFGSAVIIHDFTSLDIDFTCQSVHVHISKVWKRERFLIQGSQSQVLSSSELNLFVQIATSGDSTVAAAIGKRYLLGIEGFKQDFQKAASHVEAKRKLENLDPRWYKIWVFGIIWPFGWIFLILWNIRYRIAIIFRMHLGSGFLQAKQYLKLAANRQHAGALALLGYIYCLGDGTMVRLHSKIGIFESLES